MRELIEYAAYGDKSRPNYIIYADNCEACDLLAEKFKNTVKCIYIDPPYNNGEEYLHYSDNITHQNWINGMRIILGRLWAFLTEEGSIWISIDDNEMHYLKVLCDEVFGRECFVTTIVWNHRNTRENRSIFSNNHEYILVFAKNMAKFKNARNGLEMNDDVKNRYSNPDNDPRGPWQSVTLNVQAGHAVSSQFYSITSPDGTEFLPPNGRCWIYNQKRMCDEISNNNVWFGKNGNCVPRKKKFFSDAKMEITPETLWLAKDVGTTNDAKKQLLSMFPSMQVFDTPKPESLIRRIIEISTNEDDLVMDVFLGSGTTAAVAHKLNRRYIGIDSSSDSIEYSIKRLKMVVNGENGGISNSIDWKGGGGFHFLAKCEK